jgi:hypothetical protein
MGMWGSLWGTRRSRRAKATVTIAVLASCGLAGGVLAAEGALSSDDNVWPYAATPDSPVLATVGDISCQPTGPVEGEKQKDVCDKTGTGSTTRFQAQTATANEVEALKPNLVALLGDEQYQVGRYVDFMGSFDHTYGAFKFLHRPAPGNHEFYDEHGETGVKGYGYFDYYNGYQLNANGTTPTTAFGPDNEPIPRPDGQAGDFGATGNGWYSYDLGDWHIISLNAECAVQPGGCDPNGSWFKSETDWLAQDLQGDREACTLAYWHQPTFSAQNPSSSAGPGADPEGPTADAWWKLLYEHGADVVLNGHDHLYARFAPMDPAGNADAKKGIREFIVGTGGESLDALDPSVPNLEKGTGSYYGVMKLALSHNGYSWDFESASGAPSPGAGTFSDTGTGRCHGPA